MFPNVTFIAGVARASAVALALAASLAGCANSGFGEGVRKDVGARMTAAGAPISACYEAALARNRKLKGTMQLAFVAEKGTGKFTQVRVERTDLADPELERCVVEQVGRLALETPQKANVSIQYPLEFAWLD